MKPVQGQTLRISYNQAYVAPWTHLKSVTVQPYSQNILKSMLDKSFEICYGKVDAYIRPPQKLV